MVTAPPINISAESMPGLCVIKPAQSDFDYPRVNTPACTAHQSTCTTAKLPLVLYYALKKHSPDYSLKYNTVSLFC